jgi:hypothetical protein
MQEQQVAYEPADAKKQRGGALPARGNYAGG